MRFFLLVLTVPVAAAALLVARREYRQRGKLSIAGLALVCAMLLVPILLLHTAISYALPVTLLDFLGVVTGAAGLALCLASMRIFHSAAKVFCLDAGKLTTWGPYRWSRNPQYVGAFLFLLGFALNEPSLWSLAALLAIAASLHLLVLVEEEHLLRTFGEGYAQFCRTVPRYVGWRKLRK